MTFVFFILLGFGFVQNVLSYPVCAFINIFLIPLLVFLVVVTVICCPPS